MKHSFSKWPGAWERHLIRRCEYPQYFEDTSRPTSADISDAQLKDQQELAKFHTTLESILARSVNLTDDTCVESITAVKKDLDVCHDTACGLATDLTDQKNAIAALNEIITATMQRTLNQKDDPTSARLLQNEAARMQQLDLLEYPIVCDLLRCICPIPKGEVTGALLSEPDSAYKAALQVLDKDRKAYLAQRIDIIVADLKSEQHTIEAVRKLQLLQKELLGTPATESITESMEVKPAPA